MTARLPRQVTRDGVDRRSSLRRPPERMLQLADCFDPYDRLLIEQICRHGTPIAHLARLAGKRPRTLQKRLNRLARRVRSPLFAFVAGRGDELPPTLRAVAQLAVLQGASLRRTARATDLSLHTVRRHLQTLRILAAHQPPAPHRPAARSTREFACA